MTDGIDSESDGGKRTTTTEMGMGDRAPSGREARTANQRKLLMAGARGVGGVAATIAQEIAAGRGARLTEPTPELLPAALVPPAELKGQPRERAHTGNGAKRRVARRVAKPSLYSDQGSQYVSLAFGQAVREAGIARTRRHSTLGMLSPSQYEDEYLSQKKINSKWLVSQAQLCPLRRGRTRPRLSRRRGQNHLEALDVVHTT